MAKCRVKINGKIALDTDLDQWQNRPPEFIAEQLKPGHRPEPAMLCLMGALTEAAARNVAFDAILDTFPTSWKLQVRYA